MQKGREYVVLDGDIIEFKVRFLLACRVRFLPSLCSVQRHCSRQEKVNTPLMQ
jgi:hypothetical protein